MDRIISSKHRFKFVDFDKKCDLGLQIGVLWHEWKDLQCNFLKHKCCVGRPDPLFCGLRKQRFQGFKRLTNQMMARYEVVCCIKSEVHLAVLRFPSNRFEGQINCQRGILIHQWRPSPRISKNEELSWSHRKPDFLGGPGLVTGRAARFRRAR